MRALAPYHWLLALTWPRFLFILAAYYVLVNAFFAAVYMLCGATSLSGTGFPQYVPLISDYLRAYFFSVETFGTVGYGNIAPVGVGANVVMTTESFVGLISAALATGLIFARFSRPVAAILYSRHAVVAPYRDTTGFMFRCANERSNQLTEVEVRILYTRISVRANGERVRDFTMLPLEFSKVTFFALSWTVVHPIDDASPLKGLTHKDLIEREAEFLVLLTGNDETFAQTVHSRTSYRADEVIWGAKFRSMFLESAQGGATGMDLSRIHDYEIVQPL